MSKFRDLFTENFDSHKLYNKNYLENLKVNIPKNLIKKIPGPLIDNNLIDVLLEINQSNTEGKNHILFNKWINKYKSDNILIPTIDNLNLISYKIIISSSLDSEKIANKHIQKDKNFLPLLHDSIISTIDNKHWKNQRMDLVEAFTTMSLSKILNISSDRAKKSVNILKSKKQPVNMADFFLNETMAQLQLAMFGVSEEFEEKSNKKMRQGLAGLEKKGTIRNLAFDLIDESKKSSGPLSNILNERIPETDTEKYGNALIFMFAGHDTTGLTLTWLLYELSKNQKYQIRLQKEVDLFWSKFENKEIKLFDFKSLKFMTKCIMETLRLWTVVANGTFRELLEDDFININGKKVKLLKGTKVQIFNWTKHHDKKLWGDDVDIFNPDREFKENEIWDNNGYAFYNPSTDRYSPFTYAPRDCIGKNFAQMEMRLILLNLVKNFHFVLTKEQAEVNQLEYSMNNATLAPRDIYRKEKLNNKFRPYRVGMYFYFIPRVSKI